MAPSINLKFNGPMSPKLINILFVVVLILLSLSIFANSMTKPLGRDEHMYCTAGALLAQGKMIYRDFSYPSQMPCHPLLYAAAFKILSTTHYLLVGRILSSTCDILVAILIVCIYRRTLAPFLTSGTLLGLAAAALYVFNPLVDYANGFAWNHDVVILLVLLSYQLFTYTDSKRTSNLLLTAALASLLTLATCMRITTILVQLLFFMVLLTKPANSAKHRSKTILAFAFGTTAVLIWPLWTILKAPQAFLLNLFAIPRLYGQWLHQIGMVHNKFDLLFASLTTPGYFVLLAIAVYLSLTLIFLRRTFTIPSTRHLILAALLPLTFFVAAFIPPTMWRQYLAVPVPFLVISFALPLSYLRKMTDRNTLHKHFKIAACTIALSLLLALISLPTVFQRIPRLTTPHTWTPIQVHKIADDIAKTLKTKNRKHDLANAGPVLTLAPLYALEAGCSIYAELSAGSIVYRIADLMTPSDRALTKTVGPKTLPPLLQKSPPSAVIVGAEAGFFQFLEAPLFESAVKPDLQNWQRKTCADGLILYFRR